MEPCSIGQNPEDCSGERLNVSPMTDDVSISLLGVTKHHNCPNVETSEGWLLLQRRPELAQDYVICKEHRRNYKSNSVHWTNLGKKCWHPNHQVQRSGKKRAFSGLRIMTIPEIMKATALYNTHIPYGGAMCAVCRIEFAAIEVESADCKI